MLLLFRVMLVLAANADSRGDAVFVTVPAGTYTVGEVDHPRNPRRDVALAAFSVATTEVTNAQFAKFVEATQFVTDAERHGFGMTFREGMDDWEWYPTPGAYWRKPFGPDEPGIEDKPDHPVTQVSFNDAQAYCRWVGGRLPTVEEWEVAARAGTATRWPWGDEFAPEGKYRANTWQGVTHRENTMEDGHRYTAPAAQFEPNAWGLYDVIGNVFEYCVDESLRDPRGVLLAAGRGGSWWCSTGTCDFFNLVDIGRMHPEGSLANQGFRMVRDVK